MDVVALVGRILFVLVFLGAGTNHLTSAPAMTAYAESKRVPAARVVVIGSGVWIVIGALLVLLGLWGDLGALMLFVFLVGTAFVFHDFWTLTDAAERQNDMNHFLKDLALAGASLLLFVLFLEGDPGPAIVGPLFG